MKRMSQDRNSGGFGPRLIRTRYAGSCSECRIALPAGSRATWHPRDKTLTCESCRHASVAVEASAPASAARMQLDDGAAESPEVRVLPDLPDGVAGGSAQREYERRRDRYEEQVRSHHPRIGGLLLALSGDPASTKAWAKGADGERRLGTRLDTLTEAGVVTLHDRRIPRFQSQHRPHRRWLCGRLRHRRQAVREPSDKACPRALS